MIPPLSAPPCGDTDNGATIIQDSAQHRFFRKNFGLNGVVDARQCGVVGDGATEDYTALNQCLVLASSLSIPVVNTGGGRILDDTASIAVPDNIELTCGGTNISVIGNDDFRKLPNSIILDPTDSHRWTIALSGVNSALTGCNVEAGVGSGTPTNTYSPTNWYPNCDPAQPPCTNLGTAMLRSAILEASAFGPGGPAYGSIGLTISAEHVAVRNVSVLGFGTCYSLNSSGTKAHPIIENLAGDCNNGITIINSNNPHIDSFNIRPILTGGDYADFIGDIEGITASGGGYNIAAEVDDFYDSDSVALKAGDTVWIATGVGGGRESARGRWTIGTPTTVGCLRIGVHHCQQFSLINSVSSPISAGAVINAAIVNGTPPTAMQQVSPSVPANFKLISPGQVIADSTHASCIAGGTTVTAVWPARGIVYVSASALCSNSTDTFTFTDNAYTAGNHCTTDDGGTLDQQSGCLYVDAAFRYGDGVTIGNTGGASVTNCIVFEHMVSYHMIAGAAQGRWVNCATGDNISLPDRNLAGILTDGNLVSLWISGTNGPASDDDACDMDWSNSVLGQHRPVAILVQSACSQVNKFTNITMGVNNAQRNGIGLELDGGGVALVNAAGSGAANLLVAHTPSYTSNLSISNNYLSAMTLYTEDSTASASTIGCGNVFASPTPYLCAPASVTQAPGGRLTLTPCSGTHCYPVMQSDVNGTANVYYVPYIGQLVPMYTGETGAFGLMDIGGGGLSLSLDTTNHLAGKLYDVFADIHAAGLELCTGPAWGATDRSADVTQAGGIWVNIAQMSCIHNGTARACPAFQCTYLGTFYAATAGQTLQQFHLAAATGGTAPCLCLYNAYNRVALTSVSLDSQGAYDYSANTWRVMGNSSNPLNNKVSVVDGLGQMQVSARLGDAINKKVTGGGPGSIGINFNVSTGTPLQIAQTATTTQGTYEAFLATTPSKGLWFVQAMENAPNGTTATFGGSGFQALSVRVDD